MEKLYFKITGEYLTEHYRTICLEGRWNEAKQGLLESLGGVLESQPYIDKLLAGDMKLEGEARIGTEDPIYFKNDNNIEYKQQLSEVYMKNTIYKDNKFYKLIACINTIKKSDNDYDIASRVKIYLPDATVHMFINEELFVLKEISSNDIPGFLISIMKEENYISKNIKIITDNVRTFGIIEDEILTYPDSQKEHLLNIIAYNKAPNMFNTHYLDTLSYKEAEYISNEDYFRDEVYARTYMIEEIKSRNFKNYISELRGKIIAAANENGGFMEIGNEETSKFNVPKYAFLNWAFSIGHYKNMKNFIPEWKTISPSGLKCNGDSPYHSDFVIGAGFEPDEFYDNQNLVNASYASVYKIKGLEMLTLSGSGLFKKEQIFIANKDTAIEDCVNKVIVIENADVEMFEIAKVAKLIIVQNGGPGSHLVINSKEYNLNVIMIRNALQLNDKLYYDFDLDNETFTVREF